MGPDDPLHAARDALARHDWQAAYEASEHTDGTGDGRLEAARLDVRSDAAFWLGHMDEAIECGERAYASHQQAGDTRRAATCATRLYEYHHLRAQPAIAGAWLRRARRLLADDVDCEEHAALELVEAEGVHERGDLDAALTIAARVVARATALGSVELEAMALQLEGRLLIDRGQPARGLERLDEAMLHATEGSLSPFATGKVQCSMIAACELLGDLRRAAEWTDAASRWTAQHPFALFPGICRVHRAWALQWRGEWADAEREARHACEHLSTISRLHTAAGYIELGEVLRRLGDLEGAEAAYREAESLTGEPKAGLALVRLAQGRPDAATAIITQALQLQTWNRLARAKLLPARVQIALAVDDLTAAAAAADELDAIAAEFATVGLDAEAATARGRFLLGAGDPAGAHVVLQRALACWQDLEVPYEVATVWALLGRACRALGNEEAATRWIADAAAAFDRLGAAHDLQAIRDGDATAVPAGLSAREVEVLRLVAAGQSNKAIGAALYVSDRTVDRHVSNIFTKLGVRSRSAAAAFAVQHGLTV